MHLTSKHHASAEVFVAGFLACIKVMGEEPIQDKEVDELIFQEVVHFIKGAIEHELVSV